MKSRLGKTMLAAPIFLIALSGAAFAQDSNTCSLATLSGLYVFDATGYNIVNLTPQPKAVVEFLDFKGDGTMTSQATVSLDGVVHRGISGSGS